MPLASRSLIMPSVTSSAVGVNRFKDDTPFSCVVVQSFHMHALRGNLEKTTKDGPRYLRGRVNGFSNYSEIQGSYTCRAIVRRGKGNAGDYFCRGSAEITEDAKRRPSSKARIAIDVDSRRTQHLMVRTAQHEIEDRKPVDSIVGEEKFAKPRSRLGTAFAQRNVTRPTIFDMQITVKERRSSSVARHRAYIHACISLATKRKVAASHSSSSRLEAPLGVGLGSRRGGHHEGGDFRKVASREPPFSATMRDACYSYDASSHSTGTFVRARRRIGQRRREKEGKGEGKHRQCPRVNGRPVDDRTTLCQSRDESVFSARSIREASRRLLSLPRNPRPMRTHAQKELRLLSFVVTSGASKGQGRVPTWGLTAKGGNLMAMMMTSTATPMFLYLFGFLRVELENACNRLKALALAMMGVTIEVRR
ncbi:hypothetical protein DBV15_10050 [Temnothorax longispinosus]|uniref:Uncharacterized protein n=1 Tax=Temnothorax longispinosus TaxID=300112 RepID=A0A4S2L308_9HYME|nr:hypothetical protein DBV15_10050 [Temnothorax longispinosus]